MSQSPQGPNLTDIFINYRRADTSGHAGRLEPELSRRFPGRVFMDIHTIEVGTDFAEAINSEVGKCGALIVLIGNQWLDITDPKTGKRRLDNPNDFVAIEIAEALKRNIRVIPVLVEGAKMPEAEELPAALAGLVRRNALEITDTRWDYDVQQLIKVLEKICGDTTPIVGSPNTGAGTITNGTGSPARWGVAKIAIGSTVATLFVIALIMYLGSGKDKKTPSSSNNATDKVVAKSPDASKSPEATSDAPDQAVVKLSEAEAEFLFPFDTAGKWEWYLNKSKIDQFEYRWGISVVGEKPNGNDYFVAVYLEKTKGDDMTSGNFKSLINSAEMGVQTRKAGEYDFGDMDKDFVKITPRAQPDGLKIALKGEGVKRIFAHKPKEVNLTTLTPKQKMEYEETVDVKYLPN